MLLLFDYDGVIVDSFDSLLQICIEAQVFIGSGRAPVPADFQNIENLTFDELGRTIGLSEEKLPLFSGKIFEIQRRGWKTSPFPDIVGTLLKLSKRHILIVVTSSQSESVAASLKVFGLDRAVTTVSGGESGESKADRIKHIRSIHGVTAEETIMIGDTVGDIRAGKEAGVRTAAVTWGYQNKNMLLRESPDHLINKPDELLSLTEMGDAS